MDLVVRPVIPDDAEAIVAILNPIILAGRYTVFDSPFSVEDERTYIERLPARGLFLAAVDEATDRIAGFQTMEPFADYTRAFAHVGVMGTYVDESYRRKGVASRLFAATFDAAQELGYAKIFTFVRADNPTALETYLAHGFSVIGTARKQAKIDGKYIDEILIEKLFE